MIPLFRAHIPQDALAALAEVCRSGYLADGDSVRRFEAGLRAYLENPHLITAGEVSGAITLCLFLAGVRPGDEVIASPMACVATNQPVLNLFARVVWCDVDPETGMMAPELVPDLITPRTKAVLVPHWAGDVAEIDPLRAIARSRGLRLIEDAGEALGAEYRGRKVGNAGADFTVFSFHAIRHITTGEGAAITFAREEEAWEAQKLKRYGIDRTTFRDSSGEIDPGADIPVAGYNTYMTNLAGAIGAEQIKRLADIVARHRENGVFYDEAFGSVPGVARCARPAHRRSSYWVYTLRAERRDDLMRALNDRGVHASTVHRRNDRYSCFGTKPPALPGVDEFSRTCLCLPCGWWVSDEDRERVVAAVRRGW